MKKSDLRWFFVVYNMWEKASVVKTYTIVIITALIRHKNHCIAMHSIQKIRGLSINYDML